MKIILQPLLLNHYTLCVVLELASFVLVAIAIDSETRLRVYFWLCSPADPYLFCEVSDVLYYRNECDTRQGQDRQRPHEADEAAVEMSPM